MSHRDPWEELEEIKRKAAEEKTKRVEQRSKDTDPLLSYTAKGTRPETNTPPIIPAIRAWWWRILTDAMTDPVYPPLIITCVREIYYVESIMSRYLALPEVLHDPALEGDYRALVERYSDLDTKAIREMEDIQ
jgi:hypothetical protein